MNRLIRWKGLAAFAAFCLALWLFWWLLAGWLVKISIQKAATAAVGAEVDVGKVKLSILPPGLRIDHIEVTDPDNPRFNLVAVARAEMAIAAAPLLRRKLIIENMQVQGLRFGTRRARPGKVLEKRKPQEPSGPRAKPKAKPKTIKLPDELCFPAGLPALSLPDARSILEREKLASLEEARRLEKDLERARKEWETRLKQLPDEKKLAVYRRRLEEIRQKSGSLAGILDSAGKIRQLTVSIRQDIALLEKAKNDFQAQAGEFRRRAVDLSKLPARDLARLKRKYSLSGKGLSNLSRLLFGKSLCHWYQTAARWYFKIEPYLHRLPASSDKPVRRQPVRGRGLDIRFAETNPLPDFWLQEARLGLILKAGEVKGSLSNLSDSPVLVGKPTVLRLLGRNLENLGSLSLVGSLDFTRPRAPHHRLRSRTAGLKISDLTLETLDALPVKIETGSADLALDLEAEKDRLTARIEGKLTRLKLAAGAGNVSGLAGEIARALEKVRGFGFQVDMQQRGSQISSRVSSDLDQVLKKAVASSLADKTARLERQLRSAISEKVAQPLANARQKVALLGPLEKMITRRLDLGNDLLQGLKLPF